MWFVVIGVVVLGLNVAGVGPIGAMVFKENWYILLSPFAMAIAWWLWADSTGWTQRRAMDKVDAKREARRQRLMAGLGMGEDKKRR